jgi:glycosyltransferase involved in cell wall biosynthesis
MSKEVNDNAYMLIRLREKGLKLTLIACRSKGQKGEGSFTSYENMDGIDIYRLYEDYLEMFLFPYKGLNKILEIAKDLKPDLIYCDQELNMRLALLIQKYLNKPIVLHVEDAGRILSGERYNGFKMKSVLSFLGIPRGPKFWSWLCKKADVLITSSPRDVESLASLSKYNKPVFYLLWPSYIPENFEYATTREKGKGIYVGSLYSFKNTQEFEKTIPEILEKTKTKQFVVVGPGSQASTIKKLEQQYGSSIKYISHLSRIEALRLMSNSFYAYTPVKIGGWGFIGDCWSTRTPIIMTHNDDYVVNEVNALVSKNENELIANINRLYNDAELYQRLQSNGYEEYEKRKATVVGDKLFDILTKVRS